ncbi:MAG: gas vesicle protein [Candidatus Methanoperedens sp.]|nr:gas vesicle protein [Candidatus Methanoperedens sp.]
MTVLRPESSGGLADAIERILDKGLVINADISVSVAGTELLGIKIRAALASFETAALYGLDFPSGTNLNAAGWREVDRINARSHESINRREEHLLIEEGFPISGLENLQLKKNLKTDMV